ncbi:Protein kinase-like (PK-like) [Apiospora hydei]|uniref:Protein kinase-like (PK-like) n=1 Tax=Apiospora hydei TaxID=1337664 RepID=A0ABR1WR02_9PEZI
MSFYNPERCRFKITGIDPGDADGAAVILEDSAGRRIAVSPTIVESGAYFNAAPICEIIHHAAGSLFSSSYSGSRFDAVGQDLQTVLDKETIHFRYRTDADRPYLAPIYAQEANIAALPAGDDGDDKIAIYDDLPYISATELEILEVFTNGPGIECRVRRRVGEGNHQGEEMFCLAERNGLHFPPFLRHLNAMQAVHARRSEHPALYRIPKLLGYVKYAESERVIGLLGEWVPAGLLGEADDVSAPWADRLCAAGKERKGKWVRQIRETVEALHVIGVSWGGSGHLYQILVDLNDDVCLHTFGTGGIEETPTRCMP